MNNLCRSVAGCVAAGLIILILALHHGHGHGAKAESVPNDILLMVTKISDIEYHLEWVDLVNPLPNPSVYKVYRSEDPTMLGIKIATVNGFSYNDVVSDPTFPPVYYYQIIRLVE